MREIFFTMAWRIWNNRNLAYVGGKKGHALIKEVAEKVIEYICAKVQGDKREVGPKIIIKERTNGHICKTKEGKGGWSGDYGKVVVAMHV